MTVKLKVEHREPSAGELAVLLAEALNTIGMYRADADAFSKQADNEQSKIADLRDLLVRVHERDERIEAGDPLPTPKSRMDPMLTYDAMAIATELGNTQQKIAKLRADAAEQQARATKLQTRARSLQVDIKRANKREKLAANGAAG